MNVVDHRFKVTKNFAYFFNRHCNFRAYNCVLYVLIYNHNNIHHIITQ